LKFYGAHIGLFLMCYRGGWCYWKACRPNQGLLWERVNSRNWEDCVYSSTRKRLVTTYSCHAKSWRPGIWRLYQLKLYSPFNISYASHMRIYTNTLCWWGLG